MAPQADAASNRAGGGACRPLAHADRVSTQRAPDPQLGRAGHGQAEMGQQESRLAIAYKLGKPSIAYGAQQRIDVKTEAYLK